MGVAALVGFLLSLATCARLTEEQLDEIKSTRRLKVTGSSDDTNYDGRFQKFCFTIDIEDKNKKIAYEQSVLRLSKIQRYFKIKSLIPDEASLTIRKVEARLNRKRRGTALVLRSVECHQDCLLPLRYRSTALH